MKKLMLMIAIYVSAVAMPIVSLADSYEYGLYPYSDKGTVTIYDLDAEEEGYYTDDLSAFYHGKDVDELLSITDLWGDNFDILCVITWYFDFDGLSDLDKRIISNADTVSVEVALDGYKGGVYIEGIVESALLDSSMYFAWSDGQYGYYTNLICDDVWTDTGYKLKGGKGSTNKFNGLNLDNFTANLNYQFSTSYNIYSDYQNIYIGGAELVITCQYEDINTPIIIELENSVDTGFSKVNDKLDNIGGQLGGINDSINQGFDGILKPDSSDKAQSDKFGSGMSDKVEQGGNILEDMGQMQQPDIDSVIGDDILSDNEADSMLTLMDTVQPILGSALFGRILLISLILALVAYIFYGKR